MTSPWVQTRFGVAFDLLAPRVEDVRLDDIAAHLSKIARYSGATIGVTGYSVAQHSVLCADIVRTWGGDARLQREALLHDAGEAYYGDATSPVKRALVALLAELGIDVDPYALLAARVDPVVREALGLRPTEPALVKRADLVALAIERKFVMAECERDWCLPELADTRWTSLVPIYAQEAERAFVQRHAALVEAL